MSNNILSMLSKQGLEALGRYYSIYEARVIDNQDPTGRNRLKVSCPNILAGATFWARPRGQCGTDNYAFKFITPGAGDFVYVTFMNGDLALPLWEYRGFDLMNGSKLFKYPSVLGFITKNGNSVILDDGDQDTLSVDIQGSAVHNYAGDNSILSKGMQHIDGEQGLILANGENGGLVKIKELTAKLNQLVSEIEAIKVQINTHTHPGVMPGPSTTSPPATPITQKVSQFVQSDYEDSHTIH